MQRKSLFLNTSVYETEESHWNFDWRYHGVYTTDTTTSVSHSLLTLPSLFIQWSDHDFMLYSIHQV